MLIHEANRVREGRRGNQAQASNILFSSLHLCPSPPLRYPGPTRSLRLLSLPLHSLCLLNVLPSCYSLIFQPPPSPCFPTLPTPPAFPPLIGFPDPPNHRDLLLIPPTVSSLQRPPPPPVE